MFSVTRSVSTHGQASQEMASYNGVSEVSGCKTFSGTTDIQIDLSEFHS